MDTIVVLYGTALIIGGSIGFLKKKSAISLFAGSTFGGLMIFCGMEIESRKKLATVLSLLLMSVMTTRYLESKKFMPPGMVATLSALMAMKLVFFH